MLKSDTLSKVDTTDSGSDTCTYGNGVVGTANSTPALFKLFKFTSTSHDELGLKLGLGLGSPWYDRARTKRELIPAGEVAPMIIEAEGEAGCDREGEGDADDGGNGAPACPSIYPSSN